MQEMQVQSLGWVDTWRRKWQTTPVFLPGKFHGWRSLAGYSPHGHNRTERLTDTFTSWDFPGGPVAKTLCSQCRIPGFDPSVRKILWRREWQPTRVFLPRESHGLRSLVGYSPGGFKELDMTERLHFFTFFHHTGLECKSRKLRDT